jgi:tRNA(adenine34) deaminase
MWCAVPREMMLPEGAIRPKVTLECLEQPQDLHYMQEALALAKAAAAAGEVPVGALIVHEGRVLATGRNSPIADHDATAHAEVRAIRAASAVLKNYRIAGATLYVTLEPCVMCAGAILHSRIQRLVFGAWDPRAGAVRSVYPLIAEPKLNHAVQYTGGVLAEDCGKVLKEFFRARR